MKTTKKRKWFKLKLLLGLKLILLIAGGCFIYGLMQGRKTAPSFYTDLPNSCFVESILHASKANLVLGADGGLYSSVYAFTYYYRDDYEKNRSKAKLFGHAVCIFEYKDTLWVYDSVWGTMPVGKVTSRKLYSQMLKKHIELYYKYKLIDSFVVDDWNLPAR